MTKREEGEREREKGLGKLDRMGDNTTLTHWPKKSKPTLGFVGEMPTGFVSAKAGEI